MKTVTFITTNCSALAATACAGRLYAEGAFPFWAFLAVVSAALVMVFATGIDSLRAGLRMKVTDR